MHLFRKPHSRHGRVYNLIRDPVLERPRRLMYAGNPANLPPSVDLSQHFPAPYDQGQWGTCYSNAAAAIVQFMGVEPSIPSRLFIAWNACVDENDTKEENGIACLRDVLDPMTHTGFAEESMTSAPWDYVPANLDVKPPDAVFTDATKRIITGYAAVPQDIATIKASLHNGNPILFGMLVYPQFESDQCMRNGMVAYPSWFERHLGRSLGGHAVVAVGYDDAKKRVKVRNSWGPNVQDHGHFWLPYEYVLDNQMTFDLWVVNGVKNVS